MDGGQDEEVDAAAWQPGQKQILCFGKDQPTTLAVTRVTCTGGSGTDGLCICCRVWCGGGQSWGLPSMVCTVRSLEEALLGG